MKKSILYFASVVIAALAGYNVSLYAAGGSNIKIGLAVFFGIVAIIIAIFGSHE